MANQLAIVRSAFSDIQIDDFIDAGGQGVVFRGSLYGKPVAVKLFDRTNNPRRLDRELDLLKKIDCPYLVKVVESRTVFISGQQVPVVIYEYHSGGDLRNRLAPTRPLLPVQELLKIGLHVGTAVEELWQKRIVHRDIKPGNIVASQDGRFILVDVGLARHVDRSDITAPGGAPGTSGYKSPEQAKGRRSLTISSDVFSLGVTLYELATKIHPFNKSQALIGAQSPPLASKRRSDLPEAFCRLLKDMLANVPANRPRTIAARFHSLLGK